MNGKGQGALEYLLLIGGAVLVAAIVIALISGVATHTANPEDVAYCASLTTRGETVCKAGCPPSAIGACDWGGDPTETCYYEPTGAYPTGC